MENGKILIYENQRYYESRRQRGDLDPKKDDGDKKKAEERGVEALAGGAAAVEDAKASPKAPAKKPARRARKEE